MSWERLPIRAFILFALLTGLGLYVWSERIWTTLQGAGGRQFIAAGILMPVFLLCGMGK